MRLTSNHASSVALTAFAIAWWQVYYSPALLRHLIGEALPALRVLAEVYRSARGLFPLSDSGGGAIVYVDRLKTVASVCSLCSASDGHIWLLLREGNNEAVTQPFSLFDNRALPTKEHWVLRFDKSLIPKDAVKPAPARTALPHKKTCDTWSRQLQLHEPVQSANALQIIMSGTGNYLLGSRL